MDQMNALFKQMKENCQFQSCCKWRKIFWKPAVMVVVCLSFNHNFDLKWLAQASCTLVVTLSAVPSLLGMKAVLSVLRDKTPGVTTFFVFLHPWWFGNNFSTGIICSRVGPLFNSDITQLQWNLASSLGLQAISASARTACPPREQKIR